MCCEMRVITCTLFIFILLWDNVRAEITIKSLKQAAVAWRGALPCRNWDCECAFKHQRGCCCAALEVEEMENQIFQRLMGLLTSMYQLGDSMSEVIGGMRVAFMASMSNGTKCLGPFTMNKTIPYDVISLNHGTGYNPALGTFTAPCSGLYSFSFSIYSKVGGKGERMYYKVQLMRDGEVVASTSEDHREDSEDSSSQTVLLSVQKGGQVYVELLRGRQLCGITEGLNTFSGSLIYSTPA